MQATWHMAGVRSANESVSARVRLPPVSKRRETPKQDPHYPHGPNAKSVYNHANFRRGRIGYALRKDPHACHPHAKVCLHVCGFRLLANEEKVTSIR